MASAPHTTIKLKAVIKSSIVLEADRPTPAGIGADMPKTALPCNVGAAGCGDPWGWAAGQARLVSRFRSSHSAAAPSDANFGIKGHSQLYDFSAAFKLEVRKCTCREIRANFGFAALVEQFRKL
jgi:hypothetical protein